MAAKFTRLVFRKGKINWLELQEQLIKYESGVNGPRTYRPFCCLENTAESSRGLCVDKKKKNFRDLVSRSLLKSGCWGIEMLKMWISKTPHEGFDIQLQDTCVGVNLNELFLGLKSTCWFPAKNMSIFNPSSICKSVWSSEINERTYLATYCSISKRIYYWMVKHPLY